MCDPFAADTFDNQCDETRRHGETGFGRRPSINRMISANSRRGIATSVN